MRAARFPLGAFPSRENALQPVQGKVSERLWEAPRGFTLRLRAPSGAEDCTPKIDESEIIADFQAFFSGLSVAFSNVISLQLYFPKGCHLPNLFLLAIYIYIYIYIILLYYYTIILYYIYIYTSIYYLVLLYTIYILSIVSIWIVRARAFRRCT